MKTSPCLTAARTAGLLYLIPLLCGPFSMMFVPSAIVVPGDAAATAAKLLASESLFRMGMLSDAAIFISEVGLTAVLYILLRPAGRTLALAATFARMAMVVLQGVNLLPHLAALQLLSGGAYRTAFGTTELQALALLMLDFHAQGVFVWEIFFGLHCALLGVLLFRSGYFPRALGVLMALAAVGYLANGLGNLVLPRGASFFAVLVGICALVGEVPFVLWLLFRRAEPHPSSAE
jgi:Domain of unknown function (DUF4386)